MDSTMTYVLDECGNPRPEPDMLAWGKFMEGTDRHVALDEFGDVKVSTVFLGVDHGWGRQPPVLWETMVFGSNLDDAQERYTSRQEALAGHYRWVSLVSEAETP